MNRSCFALVLCAALCGCQQYQRRPLDLSAMIASWRDRAPDQLEGFDVSDGLSLPEGVAVALALNPELRAARRGVEAAFAELEHVSPLPNPTLDVSVRRVVDSVPKPWRVDVAPSFVIPLGGRRDAATEHETALARAARAALRADEWALATRVRTAWLDWSHARTEIDLHAHYVRSLTALRDAARALSAAGELERHRLDVLEFDVVEAEATVVDARAAAEMKALALRALLGLRPTAPVRLVPSLRSPQLPAGDDRAAIGRHPAILAAKARYEVAERGVALAVARQYPDLELGPALENADSLTALGPNLLAPIFSFDRNRAAIARARGERLTVEAEVATTVERLLSRAELLRARMRIHRARRDRITTTLLPRLDGQLKRLRDLAALGEIDPLLVHHVLERTRQARMDRLDADTKLSLAAIALADLTNLPGGQK